MKTKLRYRLTIGGIIFRFKVYWKYINFVKTISVLIKERNDLAEIMKKYYGLVCIVHGGNSLNQIKQKCDDINDWLNENLELRNFMSTMIYEKDEMKYWNIENLIEYKVFREICDKEKNKH